MMRAKIHHEQLRRDAVVYVRQSSAHQVRSHYESRDRQYALVKQAAALGWSADSIKTIDEDQGRSGDGRVERAGFKKLLAEVGAGQVGVVLALEASRLARNSVEWHRLVEICVVTQTLLGDDSAVYDPRDPNDRLLLGVKGTISEAELFTLRCRLHEGRWNKARRGELTRSLPVGYVSTDTGKVVKDPDRQVRARLQYVFDRFARLRVARQVLSELRRRNLPLPTKQWGGPRHGQVVWKPATFSAIIRLLHNPSYAGTYVYGQYEYDSFDRSPRTGKAKVHVRGVKDWPVCLHGVLPAYIKWDQFQENQRVLQSNAYGTDRRGAPRRGSALLQGIVFCGRCGLKMTIQHYACKDRRAPAYVCYRAYSEHGDAVGCQCMSAQGVDQAVTELLLKTVTPARIDIALRALNALEQDQETAAQQWTLQLQQARYEVELAERRYQSVDPQNRLVAASLESAWEQALKHLEQLQRRHRTDETEQAVIGADERQRVKALANDLQQVWHAGTTTMEDRKALLRMLIHRVHLDGVSDPGKIHIDVQWHTGAHDERVIDRPLVGAWAPRTADKVVRRIHELLQTRHSYDQIARILNEQGFHSAKDKPFTAYVVGYIVRSRGWSKISKTNRSEPGA